MAKKESLFLKWALWYAREMKFPVFPLKAETKDQPLVKHGLLDASLDERQIVEWWTRWPNANIAVRTGVACWVFDRDQKGLDMWEKLILQHGRPRDTLSALTPNDGVHYFYLQPELVEIPTRAPVRKDWGDGLDTRGSGGYVVIHPSKVRNHAGRLRQYLWDGVHGHKEPMVEADPWLIEAILGQSNGAPKPPFELPEKLYQSEKQRHHGLHSFGSKLRADGMDEGEILSALLIVNEQRCVPPYDRDHIVKLAHDIAARYPKGKSASRPEPRDEDVPPGPAHAPWPTHEPPPPPKREHAIESYNANCPEPEVIVEPILYPGLTIFGGRPKAGKSWFALQLGLAVVNATALAGYLTVRKKRRCLYVSLEDRKPQLKSRLHKLVNDAAQLDGLELQYELAPLLAGGAEQLDESITANPVDVLIVDSLLAAVQQANRKYLDAMQADYNTIATLRALAAKHSIAVVVVAHTRKAPGDFVDMIQGTTGTTAAADAVWALQRAIDGSGTLSVTGREVPMNTFGLKRADESPAWIITGEGDEVTQCDVRRDIMQLLRDNGPLKPSRIATHLRKPISSTHRQLIALCDLGLVVRTSYGTYQVRPPENEHIN